MISLGQLGLGACRGSEGAPPRATPVAPVARSARVQTEEPAATVDPALVDAYLRYQQVLVAAPRPRLTSRGQNRAWDTLRGEALAEDAALRAAGLSEEELEAVEPMVLAVLGRLRVLQAVGLEETVATYEQIRARIPEKGRAELDPALAELKSRQAALASLEEERARYGSPGVDAVLARQRELLAAQDAWLASLPSPPGRLP